MEERPDKKLGQPVRLSVSLDADDYAELKKIAGGHRVSIAWVVRDAVSRYLDARTPLFRRNQEERR